VDEFLVKLAERLHVFGADIISADETADWPTGKLDELVKIGVLDEIEHSKEVVCRECEENCAVEPHIRTNSDTGKTIGVFVCPRNPDIGQIEVDLNRLRRWRINKDELEKLGLLRKKVRKRRKVSSELSKREIEAYQLVHVQNKTRSQAAIEMRCSKQNVSNLLKKAEAKIKAQRSRSINWDKTQKLPEDERGQVQCSEELLEEQ
jgi:predicted DNA-binding protein (UPF0251 family)